MRRIVVGQTWLEKYLGQETASYTGETVLPRDIRRYALAIDDLNPIYFDEKAAKKGKYGGLTAPLAMFPGPLVSPVGRKALRNWEKMVWPLLLAFLNSPILGN
jgi:acyl dehydratase